MESNGSILNIITSLVNNLHDYVTQVNTRVYLLEMRIERLERELHDLPCRDRRYKR